MGAPATGAAAPWGSSHSCPVFGPNPGHEAEHDGVHPGDPGENPSDHLNSPPCLRKDASQAPHQQHPRPWSACATSPSPSCTLTATATSSPRCAATPSESRPCLASQAHETDTSPLCRGPVACPTQASRGCYSSV